MKVTAQQAMGMAWAITQQGQDVMIEQQGNWLTLTFFTKDVVLCVHDVTGSVYGTHDMGGGHLNAVDEDPLFTPGDYGRVTLPNAKLIGLLNRVADERDEWEAKYRQLAGISDANARDRAARARRL